MTRREGDEREGGGGRKTTWLVKRGRKGSDLHGPFFFFYNPTLVCGLASVNSVRPVTLAAGMLYVLVPIQLFVFCDSAAAGSEGEGKALT